MKQMEEIAQNTAKFLLQVKAIKLNEQNPFTWASGRKSPIYCDNRVTLSYPEIRTYIRQRFVDVITEKFGDIDVIAGVATGGIPQGVLVAQDLGKPFVYVRPEEKKHGLTNQIEGSIRDGQSVVVVEDLVSTGKSSLAAATALRNHGCMVKGMVAIFTYGLKVSEEAFANENIDLITLTNYDTLLKVAIDEDYISEDDQLSLKKWRKDPEKWSEDHMTL
ncbi:MAG: orotate phosphoribosyltransferase [Bacteroidales bacterium]|nr:orotate phosphoribosyltransferase [Bacteroidales bacterium]